MRDCPRYNGTLVRYSSITKPKLSVDSNECNQCNKSPITHVPFLDDNFEFKYPSISIDYDHQQPYHKLSVDSIECKHNMLHFYIVLNSVNGGF